MYELHWNETVKKALAENNLINTEDLADVIDLLMNYAKKHNSRIVPYLIDLGYMFSFYSSRVPFRFRAETALVLEDFVNEFNLSEAEDIIVYDNPVFYAIKYLELHQSYEVLKSIILNMC